MGRKLLRGMSVLIIDDERYNLDVLADALVQLHGAVVDQASSALEAMNRARARLPEIILMDLSMPGVDGWELFGIMRADATLAMVPIIAVTAHAMKGDATRALSFGFNGYVSKPIEVGSLAETIMGLLPLRGVRLAVQGDEKAAAVLEMSRSLAQRGARLCGIDESPLLVIFLTLGEGASDDNAIVLGKDGLTPDVPVEEVVLAVMERLERMRLAFERKQNQ